MSLGAHNPIYGQTRNPLDLARSPGGSSSGESAAIASGSSIIGLGSDIGEILTDIIVHLAVDIVLKGSKLAYLQISIIKLLANT